MVKKWIKKVELFQKSTNIDLDIIISDILIGEYKKYDWKKLGGHKNLYRVRIGDYRIVFMVSQMEIRILGVDNRSHIYKNLK